MSNSARRKIVEMHQEIEALKKDAERYRWLREQPNDTDAPRIDVVLWTVADESANDGEGLRMEELDSAIDAAMAKTHNAVIEPRDACGSSDRMES